jgi:dipeptidyl aminopeptidase/acylaminoacyl peptidase
MRVLALLIATLAAIAPAKPQGPVSQLATGTLVSETPCQFTAYGQTSPFTRRYYSREEYLAASDSVTTDCRRIQYVSDGFRVVGFIVKPRGTRDARFPVIVYNRGGFREIGKIDAWNLLDFHGFASRGFVVLASQYRGNDGGEGRDEVGGADVADVMALARVAAGLPYVDPTNLFLYGLSRGGMTSFLALKQGFPAKAVAVVGSVFDVEAFAHRRPKVVASALAVRPENLDDVAAILRERSVMNWPDQVTAPLLIIHGGSDKEVPALEALTFASKLTQLGKPFQLIVYADDIHEAANNRRDRDASIVAWFKQHVRL